MQFLINEVQSQMRNAPRSYIKGTVWPSKYAGQTDRTRCWAKRSSVTWPAVLSSLLQKRPFPNTSFALQTHLVVFFSCETAESGRLIGLCNDVSTFSWIFLLEGLYYGVSICLVSFASGLAVVTLNLHHRGVRGTGVPAILKSLVLRKLGKILFFNFRQVHFLINYDIIYGIRSFRTIFISSMPFRPIISNVFLIQLFSSNSTKKNTSNVRPKFN